MPIVRLSQAIREVERGGLIEVLATDRGSLSDIPAWCDTTGHLLLEKGEDAGVYRFVLRKA